MKSEIIEREVFERATAGDLDAFEALVKRYEGKVYSRARRITGNAQDAQEVTQQTFLEALERLDEFDGRTKFSKWLKRITTRTALKVYRQRWNLASGPGGAGETLAKLRRQWVFSARLHRQELTRALTGRCLQVAIAEART